MKQIRTQYSGYVSIKVDRLVKADEAEEIAKEILHNVQIARRNLETEDAEKRGRTEIRKSTPR